MTFCKLRLSLAQARGHLLSLQKRVRFVYALVARRQEYWTAPPSLRLTRAPKHRAEASAGTPSRSRARCATMAATSAALVHDRAAETGDEHGRQPLALNQAPARRHSCRRSSGCPTPNNATWSRLFRVSRKISSNSAFPRESPQCLRCGAIARSVAGGRVEQADAADERGVVVGAALAADPRRSPHLRSVHGDRHRIGLS